MARPTPKTISFEIDGRQVQAPEGTMLVDAAKHGDVEIPTFCYEPKLGHPVGACRMCLVEIEGIPKLQTGCSTPVRDGMVVNTTSDRVKHAQNAIVEFLLINHPLDCPVCDKGGECPLQDISYGWGLGHSRMIEPKRHFKKPLELSPLVAIDRERCILCYRCVRFSQEIAEDYQLVFLERGDHTFVGTHEGRPYVAPFSGNIIELCPVGALTSMAYRFRARPWDVEDAGTVCTGCAAQCNVRLTIRDDAKVVRVLARDNAEVDDGWICDKGRFGYQSFSSEERITAPLVRDGGSLRPVSWERALDEAAALLRKSGARTGAIVGGATSNEEGFLVQKLMREVLGSAHVDSRSAGRLDPNHARVLARSALTAKVSDIDYADAIVVLDVEPVDEAPILDLRVRKAVRRNGARLVTASARPSTLDGNAVAALRFAPGAGEAAVAALAAALGAPRASGLDVADLAARAGASEGFRPGAAPTPSAAASAGGTAPIAPAAEYGGSAPTGSDGGAAAGGADGGGASSAADAVRAAADALRGAGDVVILWGERLGATPGGIEALLTLAEVLGVADKPESGLIEIPAGGNGRGLREVGCLPTLAPGLADVPEAGMTRDEILAAIGGDIANLLLLQADVPEAALDAATATIAFAQFRTEALDEHANVVFPAEIYAEKEGTITHPDGRLQRVRQSLGRANEVRPGWQVLEDLLDLLGSPTGALTAPMVTAQVTAAVPFYAGITLDEIGGTGVRWQEREAASAAPAGELSDAPLQAPPAAPNGLRLAGAPALWSGPVVEHSPSLRFLAREDHAELSVADARRLGVRTGDEIEVAVDGRTVVAEAQVRTGVPEGSVFLSPPALPDGPAEITPARTRARAGVAS